MGPISHTIAEYILKNGVAFTIIAIVVTLIYFGLDLLGRNYYIRRNSLDDGSKYSIRQIRNRDIKFLICTTIFIGIPLAVYLYITFKKIEVSFNLGYFVIYLVIAVIVMTIIRKDPILLFIWITGPGQRYPLIWLLLFVLKLAFTFIYLVMMLVANIILSIFVYPIFYLILILVNNHKLNSVSY